MAGIENAVLKAQEDAARAAAAGRIMAPSGNVEKVRLGVVTGVSGGLYTVDQVGPGGAVTTTHEGLVHWGAGEIPVGTPVKLEWIQGYLDPVVTASGVGGSGSGSGNGPRIVCRFFTS